MCTAPRSIPPVSSSPCSHGQVLATAVPIEVTHRSHREPQSPLQGRTTWDRRPSPWAIFCRTLDRAIRVQEENMNRPTRSHRPVLSRFIAPDSQVQRRRPHRHHPAKSTENPNLSSLDNVGPPLILMGNLRSALYRAIRTFKKSTCTAPRKLPPVSSPLALMARSPMPVPIEVTQMKSPKTQNGRSSDKKGPPPVWWAIFTER